MLALGSMPAFSVEAAEDPDLPAQQLRQSPFALDQWQAAKIVTTMPDQVEGVQHHLMAPALASQRVEVRCQAGGQWMTSLSG